MSSIHVHSERSARTGIAIVWPANFPGSTDPELHATALFLGNTDSVDYTKEDVLKVLGTPSPGYTDVTGFSMFGRNKDVPVLTLDHTDTLVISREVLQRRLERNGITASTEFGFNPHVTISKEAEHIQDSKLFRPREIHLESPVLWWGDERTGHTEHLKWVAA